MIDDAFERYLTRLQQLGHQSSPATAEGERVDSLLGNVGSNDAPPPQSARPLHSTAISGCGNQRGPRRAGSVAVGHVEPWDEDNPVSRPDTAPGVGGASEQAIRALVDQFATTVRDIAAGGSSTRSSGGRVEMKPPQFDGSGDVHLFIQQFVQVTQLCGWDDQIALAHLRGCLTKNAVECGRADTLQGICRRLVANFGVSASEARETPHSASGAE